MSAYPAILDLIKRLEAGERSNALDVLIQVALFKADETAFDAVPNSAGTKVIYAFRDGSFATHWAHDWSMEPLRTQALKALKARTASSVGTDGREATGSAPKHPSITGENRR